MTDVYRAPAAPTVAPATAADGPVPTPGGPLSYIHWGPVFAGAVLAAAVFYVLMTFAAAVGLAVASPSPTWRDTSVGLAILSGVWLLVVALGSYGLGGYLAGRVRSSWSTGADEIEFRDGAHGLLVWALASVIGGVLIGASATLLASATTTSTANQRGTSTEPAYLAVELDRLFRSQKRTEPVEPEVRAEAGRILLSGIGRDVRPDDRTHLVRLVSARTGLAQPEADKRVAQVLAETRQAGRRTRASGIIIGFMTAASLALGAVAAWFAAGVGGRHRDQSISPPLRWDWRRRRAA
ncbi:MAG: hypothetical protein ACRECO_10760 [Xanthobacteraceae bacterium]